MPLGARCSCDGRNEAGVALVLQKITRQSRRASPGRVLRRGPQAGYEGEEEGFRKGGPGALRRCQEGGGLRGRPVIRSCRKEEHVFEESSRAGSAAGGDRSFPPGFVSRLRMSQETSSGIRRQCVLCAKRRGISHGTAPSLGQHLVPREGPNPAQHRRLSKSPEWGRSGTKL